LRLLIHDFGSYPFPWQLSQQLANQGLEVHHLVSASEPHRTNLTVDASQSHRLFAKRLAIDAPYSKSNLFVRRQWTRRYGQALAESCRVIKPDCVISANTPLDAQAALWQAASSLSCPKIFWLQDLLGVAAKSILSAKLPIVGLWIGKLYERLETKLLCDSQHVISISEDFDEYLNDLSIPSDKRTIIENWAPLPKLPLTSKDNDFAREFGLVNTLNFIYSGQLGMKHDPKPLVGLAKHLEKFPEAHVVVSAIGPGVEPLRKQAESLALTNILFVPFQPIERLDQVMATGDVLVGLLEEKASRYCVPSKVLTYMSYGKPLLFSGPRTNLASRMIEQHQTGLVAPPEDNGRWIDSAEQLMKSDLRQKLGEGGRRFAESHFQIEGIANAFLEVIQKVFSQKEKVLRA
jgi:colanic acid biosynthesis glycosyl transferase WcaI